MEDFRSLLLDTFARYPAMRMQDFVKLAYQSTYGCGHLIRDIKTARERLYAEAESVTPRERELTEAIGSGLLRLHLDAPRTCSLAAVCALFFYTAATVTGTREELEEKLAVIAELCHEGALPCSGDTWLLCYRAAGCPAVHHSDAYRLAYQPAYRVVSEQALRFLPLCEAIDKLLAERDIVTVAIDGNSGAGKSVLAQAIADAYGANLFHMDDFFLRPEQRTPERYAMPGGNVDYERFQKEVLLPLSVNTPFDYRAFDCRTMQLGERISVKPKRLRIVEGAYSQHPVFGEPYDLRVFLGLPPAEQSARILKRNGRAMWKRFMNEWIPYENAYFAHYSVLQKADYLFL